MKKTFKSLIKIAITLVVLFFIILILISTLVDINQYKSEIAQLVEQETGLKLEIHGEINLSVYSGFKLNAKNIKLSHGEELIADIDSLHMGIELYSLYIGEPETSSVELHIKTLNVFRDKNGQFNFLPLHKNKTSNKNADDLAFSYLAIKNIQLSIENFQYLDDLESVSVKLNTVKASLSLLPVIDHHELVIDDPRVLVNYIYSGELDIKQALINQYQISNLSLAFKDKKGDFIADKLAFNFIKEGADHASPPLIFDARGKLSFKLLYHIPEGASEPLWSQPDIIKIGKFDFNLPKLKLSEEQYQLETEQAHLVFEDAAIFEASKYVLDNLLIKSLSFDGKKFSVNLKNEGEYSFNQFLLQVSNLPVIYKGELLDIMSDTFLRKFAQKGSIKFSSDSLSHKSQELKNVKIVLKGKEDQIELTSLSFHAIESEVNSEGQFLLHKAGQKDVSKWQFKIHSDKLNLLPLSDLMNHPGQLEGYVTISTHLSGDFQNSKFNISNGTVKTTANNLLISGIDIDKVLEDFQNSQSVSLLDVGAVALLGPAGVLVTKGKDYRKLISNWDNKGTSKVKQLNSEISFSDGIASMNDVAFATEKYRLAVKGKINTEKNTFINFEVATVDQYGCPVYKEEVKGSLASPSVKKVNVLVSSVVNPITSLVSKVTKPLNIHCKEPFYTGVVKAPVK